MRKSFIGAVVLALSSAVVLGAGPIDSMPKSSPNLFSTTVTPPVAATPASTVAVPSNGTSILSTPSTSKHAHSHKSAHKAKAAKASKSTKAKHAKSSKKSAKKATKHSTKKVAK